MQQLKTARARENRRRIFETAISLFEKHGFDVVTMDKIASKAGVARSSVFNHYSSKVDILAEFFECFTADIIAVAEKTRSRKFSSRMTALFSAAGEAAHSHRNVISSIASLAIGHGPLAAEDSKADQALMQHITGLIKAAQSAGEVRTNIDAGFLAGLILALMTATLHDWVNGATSKELAPELAARFDILMSGAAA